MRLLAILLGFLVALDVIVLATPIYLSLTVGLSLPGHLVNAFYSSLILSLTSSLVSSLLALSISIPVGYYVSRRVTRRGLLLPIVMLPSSVSPAAIGLALLVFFVKNPLGSVVNSMFNIVNDPKGIVVAQFFIGVPIGVSYFTALFSSIPRSYEDAALTMGFTHTEYLYSILLPMNYREILIGFILVFTRVLGDFGASYVIGGGILGKTVTLPIFLFLVSQFGEISILVVVLSIYMLSVLALITLVHQAENVGRKV
ncbi:molybdate ABC transporter permease subunit [Desulfurococcus mucosus]|uniref:Binding-protein-dependent transport systems inner membrane component n=1 Tax=Desulfurococcus mucosus (strain ATCC 35584 / DSM 2162 / JCM 9187 / O7/1) TaxID=765177 RepID=E8R9U6_DESM0|nr:ABC transporter permease subunit [Desulfurococcus mucosus]ADV65272.1 binding-protein-dependent transport systems inner membrane component [Desulfurococcus mucosus DSM 2162]